MNNEIHQSEVKINNVLFWICFFVTVLAIAMALLEFFSKGCYPPSNIGIFYIGVLAIYALHKEALRFLEKSKSQKISKSGEIFVYFWLIMTAILYLINFLTKNYFSYDTNGHELNSLTNIAFTSLEVGGVFVLARIIKLVIIRFLHRNAK